MKNIQEKIKIYCGKLLLRFRVAKMVLFDMKQGFVLLQIDETNKRRLLQGKEFELTTLYVALQPFLIDVMIQKVANSKDEVDMLLSKIAFEEEAKIQYPNK